MNSTTNDEFYTKASAKQSPSRTTSMFSKQKHLVVIIVVLIVLFTVLYCSNGKIREELNEQRNNQELPAKINLGKDPPAKYNLRMGSASAARKAANETPGNFLGAGFISEFFSELTLHEAMHLVHRTMIDVTFECSDIERIGRLNTDGGYQVCVQEPYKPKLNDCLVYSFGINNEWSFDEGMNSRFGCEVHSFDPSMNLGDHMHKDNIYFHNLGIWGRNFINDRGWEMKDLKTIVNDLKHTNRIIDYLKIDVEGAEWPLIEHIVQSGIHSQVKQMMIEIHTPRLKKDVMTRNDHGEVFAGLQALKNVGFQKYLCSLQYSCCCCFTFMVTADVAGKTICCYEIFYVNPSVEI